MTSPPDHLSLPDRLRLAGFELICQDAPCWLYGAVYEAATILADQVRKPMQKPGETGERPRKIDKRLDGCRTN
jgi:hypothetical protein